MKHFVLLRFISRNKIIYRRANAQGGIIMNIWNRIFGKKVTEVERLNGRLDRDYMFNDHFIRGKAKMELMLDLSFLVMLTMAKGHIINKQENIRSLVA